MAEYFPIKIQERYAVLSGEGAPVLVEKNLETLGCTFAHFYTSRKSGEQLSLSFEAPASHILYTGLVYAVSILSGKEQESFLHGVRKASIRQSSDQPILR